MREALVLTCVVVGLLLFVAGDVTWLIARQRNRSIDLRLTGSLITVGVVLVVIASVLRST